MIYYGLIEKEPNSAFGVRFPDLPGCFSAADEQEDLVAEAQAALAFYLADVDDPPKPRTIDELKKDADVRSALADGGALLAVPVVVPKRKVRTNVMLDESLLETIDRQAKASGMSRSEYLAEASREKLGKSGAVTVKRGPKRRTLRKGAKPVKVSAAKRA